MITDALIIPNPQAHYLGEMFGISPERLDEISKQLDEMCFIASNDSVRLVYASDVLRHIEGICNTKEEFLWAVINHISWMAENNRIPANPDQLNAMIQKYGNPQNLKTT